METISLKIPDSFLRIGNKPILSRITNRFKTFRCNNPEDPDSFLVPSIINLNTSVDGLLKTMCIATSVTPVTATGFVDILVVPTNTYLTLHAFNSWVIAGTFTINMVAVSDGTNSYNIYPPGASATNLEKYLSHPITIPGGWKLQTYVDTKAVNGDMANSIIYETEDSY